MKHKFSRRWHQKDACSQWVSKIVVLTSLELYYCIHWSLEISCSARLRTGASDRETPSEHFLDPVTGVHTNTIGGTWNGMKMHTVYAVSTLIVIFGDRWSLEQFATCNTEYYLCCRWWKCWSWHNWFW